MARIAPRFPDPQRRGKRQHQPTSCVCAMADSKQEGGGLALAGESRARNALSVTADDLSRVVALCSSLPAAAAAASSHGLSPSFFEGMALRGIRVLHIRPGFIRCSFTVPNALTDATTGCLAAGAVVALVDEIGSAASISDGKNLKVSVDMSVNFPGLSQARPGDRLRITARALGHKGAYSGTHVLFTNAATDLVVAEGRHSLFGNMKKANPSTSTASSLHTSKM